MVTLRHEEQEDQHGSIPATLPKVHSAFHSLGGVGKMSSRTDGCLAWLPYS